MTAPQGLHAHARECARLGASRRAHSLGTSRRVSARRGTLTHMNTDTHVHAHTSTHASGGGALHSTSLRSKERFLLSAQRSGAECGIGDAGARHQMPFWRGDGGVTPACGAWIYSEIQNRGRGIPCARRYPYARVPGTTQDVTI
jgi:hypothetical protein